MPAIASTTQARTTVRLWERTQRVSEDIMPATVRAVTPAGNARRDDPGVLPGVDAAVPRRGDSSRAIRGATLAEMASRTATDSALGPAPERSALLDVGPARRRAASGPSPRRSRCSPSGENEAGSDGFGALDVVVVALASLPLVAWRRAPLRGVRRHGARQQPLVRHRGAGRAADRPDHRRLPAGLLRRRLARAHAPDARGGHRDARRACCGRRHPRGGDPVRDHRLGRRVARRGQDEAAPGADGRARGARAARRARGRARAPPGRGRGARAHRPRPARLRRSRDQRDPRPRRDGAPPDGARSRPGAGGVRDDRGGGARDRRRDRRDGAGAARGRLAAGRGGAAGGAGVARGTGGAPPRVAGST